MNNQCVEKFWSIVNTDSGKPEKVFTMDQNFSTGYFLPVQWQQICFANDFLNSAQTDTLTAFDLPEAQARLKTQAEYST